jgi:poly-beta-hydroxybutyrate-responsive repressor
MKKKIKDFQPGTGKRERYIQPSILMGLYIKPSYGYELIHNIQEFGFVEGEAPPGMIYRHLRQLESDGLVISEWETRGTGPAKRMYNLTSEGREVLGIWIEYLEKQISNLRNFVEMYRQSCKESETHSCFQDDPG